MPDLTLPFEIEYAHGVDLSPKKPTPRTSYQYKLILGFVLTAIVVPAVLSIFFGYSAIVMAIPTAIVCYVLYLGATYKYTPPPSILLEPRFMVCAKTVVYYSLIDVVEVNDSTVKLYGADKLLLTIDRNRFKSVSSKPEKSKLNKQKRFNKLVEELLPRISAQNQNVSIRK